MHRLAGTLLAVALVSCDLLPGAKAKPPTGPVGDIARAVAELLAPGVNVTDARFESFLADIDFAKAFGPRAAEISDQIKQERASATKAKASGAPAGGRLASVGAVFGESVTIEFAKTLADYLDEMTKASTTHELPRLDPHPHSSGGDTVTTSSISEAETITSTGPQVKLTLNWSYRETTKDKSGATLVDIAEDRMMVGSINICPDPGGAVGAFVDVKDEFTGVANGVTTKLTAKSSTVFTGYVDDSAALQNVHSTLQDQQSWESASGSGSYEATISATSNADESGSTSRGLDGNSFSGAFTANDAAAAVRGARAAAWSFVLNNHSLAESYQSAQRLWRNGRCVVVRAPDFSAETPLEVEKQNSPQYDKTVDASSETKFAVELKGRFGGLISAPVTAALSGDKKLEPSRLESLPSTLTYKAPDEDGKKATATLKSTSKRGIGTLVLDFNTGGSLTLTITGTLRATTSFLGSSTEENDTVTIGPLEFKKGPFGDVWEATGSWESTIHTVANAAGSTQTCDGSERGTLTWDAVTETRNGKKVWLVDPQDANVDDGVGRLNCFTPPVTIRGVTIGGNTPYDATGLSGGVFLSTLRSFVIPEEGGRISVQGSTSGGGRGTITATGTANAQTKK